MLRVFYLINTGSYNSPVLFMAEKGEDKARPLGNSYDIMTNKIVELRKQGTAVAFQMIGFFSKNRIERTSRSMKNMGYKVMILKSKKSKEEKCAIYIA